MDTTEDSFISAWSKADFPDENLAFIKRFCDEIGISRFEFRPGSYRYIQATRRDGTGELRIHWGCSTGFTEEEARNFGIGADEVRPATTQGVTWLVSHPEHRDVFPARREHRSEQASAGALLRVRYLRAFGYWRLPRLSRRLTESSLPCH